jgi:1-deoxy-D-xylulose-5-phosphate synthase
VVFAIDRAGISGRDGKTHQGTFDLSFLSHIPNLTVMAPKNGNELEEMLSFAIAHDGPVAIRYPKGEAYLGLNEYQAPIEYGKSELLTKGSNIAIFAVGSMVKTGEEVAEALEREGIKVTLVNVRFISPIDTEIFDGLSENHSMFVTLEENVRDGGYGQKVADYLFGARKQEIKLLNISLPDIFIEHGGVGELQKKYGLDAESVTNRIKDELKNEPQRAWMKKFI